MQIAKSVEDTILGEAKAGNFADMVAIASVIDNRAAQTKTTYQDVVAAPGQFDAYGKALPAGVSKYRDMAKQAIDQVKAYGPVHTATFYATPSATKGLPKGLAFETKTEGHQFFSDPQGRSIATAQGYKTPDPSASRAPANIAGDPSGTLYGVTAAAAPVGLPDVGPTPVSRPSTAAPATGLGLAALATPAGMARVSEAPRSSMMSFAPPTTAVRSQAVDPAVTGMVESAVSRLGPEYGWETTSGGQPAIGTSQSRVGSTRHDDGLAIDGYVTRDGIALTPEDSRQAYMDTLTNLAEAGAGGLGHYGWGIHADVGRPASWGPTTSRSSLDPGFGLAIGQGRALSSLDGAYPTPVADPRDQAAMPGRSQIDPRSITADVSRAPVGPVGAPRSAMPGRSQVTPTAPPTIEQQITAMTPAIAMPTALPTFAPAVPTAVPVPTARPTFAPPTVAPPMAVPAAVAPPSFSAPATPSASGYDVWSGAAQTAPTTGGGTLSRNPDGSVSMTSKYGYTEVDGQYRGKVDPSTVGRVGQVSIPGPLGNVLGRTAPSQQQAARGPAPSQAATRSGFGRGARGVAGSVAGGMVGGLLGPLGSILGAAIGRNLAMGKTAFGKSVDSFGWGMPTPTQARSSFAQGFQPGLGFPEAPAGNSSQGGLTSFGQEASRGDHGGQAQSAANSPGRGLY